MIYGGGHPLEIVLGALGTVISLVAAAAGFVVAVGLLLLLVRFLWFGTRAAQLYLVKNGDSARFSWPVKPVAPDAADASEAPAAPAAPAPAHTEGVPAEPTDAESRTPRKPKSPPAS